MAEVVRGLVGRRFMKSLVDRYGDLDIFWAFDHCLAPDTRVLKADLTWVPIESMIVGDKVVSFDENLSVVNGSGHGGRKLRTAVVERTSRLRLPCYLVSTSIGTKVVASEDHKWLSKSRNKAEKVGWVETRNLKKGDSLSYFCEPWEEDASREGGYIAGFFDGAASVYIPKKGSGSVIVGLAQSVKNIETLKYVVSLLGKKGFDVTLRKPNKRGMVYGYFTQRTKSAFLAKQAHVGLRAIGTFRPPRLLRKVLDRGLWNGVRYWGGKTRKVVVRSVRYLGVRDVVALKTTTGTFIAEGFLTHNSQLEIRVLAQMSGDKLLIELLQSGEDIHSAVGYELTGIPIAKIKNDRETRTAVKGIHFGIIFGLTADSLYFTLKVQAAERHEKFTMSKERVHELYDKYFHRFVGVKRFLDNQIAFAEEHGYVSTLFGFKREVSMYGDEDRGTYWKNQAVNSPIQGTAHQLILISLAVLEIRKVTYNLLQRLTMEIHDSLVGFGALRDLPEIYKQGRLLLEKEVLRYVKKGWPELNWRVPLKAESKAGFRFGVLAAYEGGPVNEFLRQWCEENKEFESEMQKQMSKAKS